LNRKVLVNTILALLVIALAAGASYWLYNSKPQTKKKRPQRPIPVVKTIALVPQNEPIVFEASGTVIPARQVVLLSEVEGRVIEQNKDLVPGGIVAEGDMLIQIDPLDYQLQAQGREAEVATAQYELDVEKGKQIIAQQEWKILRDELQEKQINEQLALRKPHLRHAEAQLNAAKSRLSVAKLAERRTTIRAPFNGLVLEEFVETGQFVGKQSSIATLVATDRFWVQVSIPLSLLDRIHFPGMSEEKASKVQVILEKGYQGSPTIREGEIFKLLGDLDPKSRMARILVTVQNPLNLPGQKNYPGIQVSRSEKILLGSFVKVRINAGILEDVYVLPRHSVREGNRVWTVNSEGIVAFREVKILWRRVDDVLVDATLPPDERIILSRLQAPVPGMFVRDQSQSGVAERRQKKGSKH